MRSDRERLEDILEMCSLLREHVAGRTEELESDPVLLAAAQRWIEIIGEAALGVSPGLRASHPEIPWQEAIGTRNILAHGYFHLDLDILREIVERDLAVLEQQLASIIEQLAE
ncbi:MAG TPA: HepT-like ribonuclease domain-containing protein [Gaiellaceae bacterium]|nr:HepT-like ribonuclease domain-containing protein [Gaiellaceae bacterium]